MSSVSRIQGITRYEKFAPCVSLCCRQVFLVSGTLGLPRTCGTMMVMRIDDYENRYVMSSWVVHFGGDGVIEMRKADAAVEIWVPKVVSTWKVYERYTCRKKVVYMCSR